MEWVIGIWLIVITLVGVNLCAAGVAAILHAWRSRMQRGGRILTAAAVAGFLPSSTLLGAGLVESVSSSSSSEEPFIIALIFAVMMVIATVLSLPGALMVARKLEAPGDVYRTFE